MGFSILDLIGGRKPPQPRRHARYETPNLRCAIGEAVDLSLGGMRVRCENKPALKQGDALPLWIEAGRKRLHITGQVAWITRRQKAWYVGITFLDADKRHHTALEQLGRYGCFTGNNSNAASGESKATPGAGASSEAPKVAASVDVENLYAILGVSPKATRDEITAAYRKLARQYHPDAQGEGAHEVAASGGNVSEFTRLNKAYTVLKDATLRQRYDELISGSHAA